MTASLPLYKDTSLPIEERVNDLLSRLTLQEKLGQFLHPVNEVPRLGIPSYNFWSEGLHGVAHHRRATFFPQAIGMAATWDRDLIQRVASAIGDEAWAKHHEAVRRNGTAGSYQGLTFWSPNINIFYDPRWGRGQETWGEDPYLTGEMGSAFVRGLQGDHPKYMKAAACAKHFAVHSGPEKLGITIRKPIGPERHLIVDWAKRKFLLDAWASETDMALSNRPITCFVAIKNKKLIGFACYDATALGFFGPTGVDKAQRGKGTGKALLLACLLDMKLKGYGYAIIGWVGPAEFFLNTVGAVEIPESTPGIWKGWLHRNI